MSRPLTWVFLLLTAIPMAAWADDPATGPENPPPGLRQRFHRPDFREIEDMNQFMAKHSPNRLAWLKRLRRNGGGAPFFSAVAWGRYRNIRDLEKEDHDLYDIKVREVEAEDDVFGLLSRSQGGPTTSTAELEPLLRQKIMTLVQVRLDEREHRIQKLQHALEEAKAKLEADRSNIDAIVDEKTKAALLERTTAATRSSTRPSEADHFGGPPASAK